MAERCTVRTPHGNQISAAETIGDLANRHAHLDGYPRTGATGFLCTGTGGDRLPNESIAGPLIFQKYFMSAVGKNDAIAR